MPDKLKTCTADVNIFGYRLPTAFWKCQNENYDIAHHRLECNTSDADRKNCEAHDHVYEEIVDR